MERQLILRLDRVDTKFIVIVYGPSFFRSLLKRTGQHRGVKENGALLKVLGSVGLFLCKQGFLTAIYLASRSKMRRKSAILLEKSLDSIDTAVQVPC